MSCTRIESDIFQLRRLSSTSIWGVQVWRCKPRGLLLERLSDPDDLGHFIIRD